MVRLGERDSALVDQLARPELKSDMVKFNLGSYLEYFDLFWKQGKTLVWCRNYNILA